MTSATGLGWSIPATERIKYDQIFDGLQPISGLLTGDKVKPVLLNSNLPVDVLSRVWELSDIDGDGMLDREEFTVAMHLVYRALEKNPVPATLPPEMIPQSKRRAVGSLVTGAGLPGAISVLPTGALAGPNAVPGAAALFAMPVGAPTSGTITSPGGLATGPGAAMALGTKWVVSPADKIKYDEMFRLADTDMDGYVNGVEIKDIFLQSGLPQMVLAHIWNLCDTAMLGKINCDQFALAMYLVHEKLKGVDPPAQLSPDMVPPSLQAGVGSGADGGGFAHPAAAPIDMTGMKELDVLSKAIEDLKQEKLRLEQDKTQKEADIKIRNGEVMSLQKELDALTNTVKQLELQKGEAQKRLDELDDKRTKLEASVTDCKDKYQDEQKQIQDLRYQITNRESIVTNQESELRKMRDELGSMRQRETDMERQVETSQRQVEQMSVKLKETQVHIEQANANIRKLREAEKSLNHSIKQYTALLKNEITIDQLSSDDVNVRIDTSAFDSIAGDAVKSGGLAAIGGRAVAKEEIDRNNAFNVEDAFTAKPASDVDPFHNEDPFASIASETIFENSDPFAAAVETSDPFGSDPFKDAFVAGADVDEMSSGFEGAAAAGGGGFLSTAASSTSSKGDALGGDPWGAAFASSSDAKDSAFDHFDPFGSSSPSSVVKSPVNPIDPFGTGSFVPPASSSARKKPMSLCSGSQSPPAPILPPKQKKAPAPPRPPAPKPAPGSLLPADGQFGGMDMTDAFESNVGSRSGASSSLSAKIEPATNFANFSSSRKLSSEAEQLAWAKRDSEQEYERQRRLREQEQADLELAIALSQQDSGFKS